MARLTVSVAVLFFFFAFSRSVARIQIRKPKYDVIVRQLSNPLPGSDVKASIRLPIQSNKVENHPAEHRQELDGMIARPEKSDQKSRPVVKQPDSNGQKAQPEKNDQKSRPIVKLPDSNGQKAQPVERRAESNKENKKPVERQAKSNNEENKKPVGPEALPVEHRPDLVAVKNQTELPIEHQPGKHNEESKPAKEAQSNDEKSKPIEDRTELSAEEAQPEPNDEEAHPVEPETKATTAMPLKQVRFRPFNRQFRLRSRLPYRLCRHSHLHHIEETMPGRSQVEIPYGNGMMITFAENGDFDQEAFQGSFNHVPPKLFPFLHHHRPHHLRRHDVNLEKVSKHLFENDHEKVSNRLSENDREKVPNRSSENDHSSVRRVPSKPISFLHRHGPHHLHQHDLTEEKVSNRVSENNHEDSNRLTENNHGSVSHIPPKWIPFHLHQHDVNEKKVSHSLPEKDHQKPKNFHHHRDDEEKRPRNEKKESTLRRRIRKFLGHYFD